MEKLDGRLKAGHGEIEGMNYNPSGVGPIS
jgi:hypothetical protein